SFGAVLYEMLTGHPAFGGDNTRSTLAAVLTSEPPPLAQFAPQVPYELERMVLRCLRKAQDRRFQSMQDVKLSLEEVRDELDSGRTSGTVPVRPVRRWRWPLAVTACSVLVLLVAGLAWWRFRTAPLF